MDLCGVRNYRMKVREPWRSSGTMTLLDGTNAPVTQNCILARRETSASDVCRWSSLIVIGRVTTSPIPFDSLLTVVPSSILCFLKTLFPKVSVLAIIEK